MNQNLEQTPTGGVRRVLADALAARPYSHAQSVDGALAAVVTVEDDLRFLPATVAALLRQTLLPGVIVIADCTGGTTQSIETSFEVIAASNEPLNRMPETKTVSVQIVRAHGARSFGDAVTRGLRQSRLDPATRALWLLHDDSRPNGERCLEHLAEAWRNTPGASLLGAKQLDWEGERLHGVGAYAIGHDTATLVVDGEPDQEQYDTRADVFSVSLAGALIPVETLHGNGIADWFTTYAQGADLCRRICRGGGRVVVVPQAGIAHRRARYEGIRSRNGEPYEAEEPKNTAMAVLDARQRYRYTDVRPARWPLMWILSLITAVVSSIGRLIAKQPYEAWCELCLPWRALAALPGAGEARRAVGRATRRSRAQLAMLTASREQIAQWRERERALADQRGTVLFGPLVRSHLRRRAVRRWGLAAAMASLAFAAVLVLDWTMFRDALGGGSLVSSLWPATDASFAQLLDAATTQWSWGVGVGVSVPPAPWLWVLTAASVLTCGNVAAATTAMFFLAAPLSSLSFWALAGVFTRSDAVRVVVALAWTSLGLALGLYSTANLPMLTVAVFLPAAFAFTFRAVGMYHTEDPVRPRPSVQAAAAAALCYMPVVAAEPQLLLPLLAAFLAFLVFVPRHRAMLLLMPVPAALLTAPTLTACVRYAARGEWRQLFADMTVPNASVNGAPGAPNLFDVVVRAFGLRADADYGRVLSVGFGVATLSMLAVLVALAVVSLVLPFALRASRMMWVVLVAGCALSLVSARVAVAPAAEGSGAVAGSVLPGLLMAMLGVLSCVCLVAGGAVRRFTALRVEGESIESHDRPARSLPVTVGRVLLTCVLAVGVVAWTGFSVARHVPGSVSVSDGGLPMIARDAMDGDASVRVLALAADDETDVSYAVMRTSRGDLIDSSPAWCARKAAGQSDAADLRIGELSARLLSNADDEAVAELASMGFGGVFVLADGAGSDRLTTNVTASDGTQAVVAGTDGTYYRLTVASGVGVDAAGHDAMASSPWRAAWLVVLAVATVLYALVAVPRRHRQERQEEA